jgi:hypothetical protein
VSVLGRRCTTEIYCNKPLSVLNQSIGSQASYPGVSVCETPPLRVLTRLRTPRVDPSCSTGVVVCKIRNALGSPQHFPSRRQLARPAFRSVESGGSRLVVGVVRPAVAIRQFLPGRRQARLSVCTVFVCVYFWPPPCRTSGGVVGVKRDAVAGRKLLPLRRQRRLFLWSICRYEAAVVALGSIRFGARLRHVGHRCQVCDYV